MSEEEQKEPQGSSDKIVGGIIVLGIGLLFLLVNLDVLPGLTKSWPAMLIIVGAAIITGAFIKGKK
jgi:hypothetical protein